jgi:hypothetical protein
MQKQKLQKRVSSQPIAILGRKLHPHRPALMVLQNDKDI